MSSNREQLTRSSGDRENRDDSWRLQNIIEGARLGTWEWNVQTGEAVFNHIWADFVGYELEELEPASIDTWTRLTHPEDLQRSQENLEAHFSGLTPWYDCRCRMRHKDGHWVWVHDRGKVITWTTDGKPLLMSGTHIDITEIMEAERRLRTSEAKYKALFEQSLLAIYVHDLDGNIIDVNDMACTQSGYTRTELLERSVFDFHPDIPDSPNLPRDDIIEVWKNWEPEDRFTVDGAHQRKDGTVYPVEISTGSVSYNDSRFMVAMVQDITDRQKAIEQRLKLQRLESLGVLAGGIAHDFNNLLHAVFGNIDLAAHSTSDPKTAQYLENAARSISQARDLTQQLLTFASGGAPVRRVGNLGPIAREATVSALSGSDVSCDFHISDELWPGLFDKNQIAQVIINIVTNARQAMSDHGRMSVCAENVEAGSAPNVLGPGRYLCLSFTDTGVGIAPEIVSRIFDPFYTTKSRGHGLGLTTSFSIVKRHEGLLDVTSAPGSGTTLEVYLPAAEESLEESSNSHSVEHVGSGLVLVMDDAPIIRETMTAVLETLGYEVVEAAAGKEAIELLTDQNARNFKAAFFDLTISGGLGGRQTLEVLRNRGVEIPVFVVSGYANDPVMVDPEAFGFAASLRKPFQLHEMAELLNTHVSGSDLD